MATAEQTQILVAIAQLDTKVEMALIELRDDVNDHEQRLRVIEKRLYAIPGIATVISLAAICLQFFGG